MLTVSAIHCCLSLSRLSTLLHTSSVTRPFRNGTRSRCCVVLLNVLTNVKLGPGGYRYVVRRNFVFLPWFLDSPRGKHGRQVWLDEEPKRFFQCHQRNLTTQAVSSHCRRCQATLTLFAARRNRGDKFLKTEHFRNNMQCYNQYVDPWRVLCDIVRCSSRFCDTSVPFTSLCACPQSLPGTCQTEKETAAFFESALQNRTDHGLPLYQQQDPNDKFSALLRDGFVKTIRLYARTHVSCK